MVPHEEFWANTRIACVWRATICSGFLREDNLIFLTLTGNHPQWVLAKN
jgi:hypothetical protein